MSAPPAGLQRVATAPRGWGPHVLWLMTAVLVDAAGAYALVTYASGPSPTSDASMLAAGVVAFPISTALLVTWMQEAGILGFLYARTVGGDLRVGRLIPLALLRSGVSVAGGSLAIGVEPEMFLGSQDRWWRPWAVRSVTEGISFRSAHRVTPELRAQIEEWCRARGVAVTVANFAY